MIQKMLGGKVPLTLYLNSIMLSSLCPQPDGTVSGDVGLSGGFCLNGVWLNPVLSPDDGIDFVRLDATIMHFASLIAARLDKSTEELLQAIGGACEDRYREQNPE